MKAKTACRIVARHLVHEILILRTKSAGKFLKHVRDYIGFKVKLLYFIMLHMIDWFTYILTRESAQIVQVCMWADNYLPRGGS